MWRMRIVMMTNTYAPHVGGVARSVEAFAAEYRRRGHQVLVVCPEFENAPRREPNVVRVPAIQRFNGSDFSVVLIAPRWLRATVKAFAPDIIHSHHPFLLGATAVRLARTLDVPLVFTHHTMYEHYTHYVPGDSEAMRRFAVQLSTNYANLSDAVFAPSQAVAEILDRRGVRVPVHVVPTGVHLEDFAGGSGKGFRAILAIPESAFLVGHVGRLAPEKNPGFLAGAVARFLVQMPSAYAVIVGGGPSISGMREDLQRPGLAERVHFVGVLHGLFLVSAYKAMDGFAFASLSETQGMVLTEAMAAGVPVVAVSAPGVDEVVRDGANGRLLRNPGPGGVRCRPARHRRPAPGAAAHGSNLRAPHGGGIRPHAHGRRRDQGLPSPSGTSTHSRKRSPRRLAADAASPAQRMGSPGRHGRRRGVAWRRSRGLRVLRRARTLADHASDTAVVRRLRTFVRVEAGLIRLRRKLATASRPT
jgi:glycosyltransferase involved in cell wall biosynthesis